MKGMINYPLDNYRNIIVLCLNCQIALNRVTKIGWVFLPTDLQWFVDWEQNDFSERSNFYKQTGKRMDRKFPDERDYESHMRATGSLLAPDDGMWRGGLYNTYILERMFAPVMIEALQKQGLQIPGKYPGGAKRWNGAPMGAITRGFVVTGAPWMKLPVREWEMLRTLQQLYSRELPEPPSHDAEIDGQTGICSAVRPQQSVMNHPQPGVNRPQSGMNHPQPGVNHPQPGVNRPQSVVNYPQPGVNRPQSVVNHAQPGLNHPQPGVNRPQSGVNHPQPMANRLQFGVNHPQPMMNYPQPVVNHPQIKQDTSDTTVPGPFHRATSNDQRFSQQ